MAQRALDMMARRAKSRYTQGSSLADKQLVQAFIADSYSELIPFRLTVLHAAWLIDTAGEQAARTEIGVCKILASQILKSIALRAIQIHGALGLTDQLPLTQVLLGGVALGLADGPTEAHRSYRQARTAAGVAMAVDGDGGMARWDRLGVYRLLAQLPHVEAEAIDPRVVRLLADADHRTIETLEAYLDLAGDAQATAQVLHIHRASLYQRLQKAERLYDFDLHSGTDRLAVHLGLKLARVTGLGAGLGSEDAGGAPAGTEHPAPPWGQIRLA